MTTTASISAGKREWLGLAVLTLPALLASMDLSVLFMAVPALTADLNPSGTQLLWIMDIYGFFMAGLLVTMGTLGDRIGRRRLLILGALAFGGASVLAAFSTSAEMLLIARALLGIGGATLAPATLALIRNMFLVEAQRRSAIAVWAAAFSAGFPLGSLIGGMLVEHFWWGSVFLINIPVMALILVIGPVLLPEYKDPHPRPFDLLGALLSVAAMLALIWGLKKFASDGFQVNYLAAVAVGIGLGYLFLRWQKRREAPLIDVSLFRFPAFSASIATNVVSILVSAGIGLLIVQYLQLGLGYDPFTAALWILPMVGSMLVGIAAATKAAQWLRPVTVVSGGLLLQAIGIAMLVPLEAGDGIGAIMLGYCAYGFGMGATASLTYNLVMATAPPGNAGAAAALNETGSEFGGAMGIAALGSVATAIYQRTFSDTVNNSVPDQARDAAAENFGNATAVAESLPTPLGEALHSQAQSAFVDGLTATTATSAGLLLIMAVIAIMTLRNVTLTNY